MLRLFLFLYIIPMLIITGWSLISGKHEFFKKAWIYSVLLILIIIVLFKIIFSILGIIE